MGYHRNITDSERIFQAMMNKRMLHALSALTLGATLLAGGVGKADSLNSRLNGRPVAEFKMHKLNYANEALGYTLMFPTSWAGKYSTSEGKTMTSFACAGKLVFSVQKVMLKDWEKANMKPDFQGEMLALSGGMVYYADKTSGRPDLLTKKAFTPACQALVDSSTNVTQTFMLIKDGKLADPFSAN